jgi:hypothetical protein
MDGCWRRSEDAETFLLVIADLLVPVEDALEYESFRSWRRRDGRPGRRPLGHPLHGFQHPDALRPGGGDAGIDPVSAPC